MSREAKQLTELCRLVANRVGNGNLPVIRKGEPEWEEWRKWRRRNNLGTVFMDQQGKWTVPTLEPPMNLAEAVEEARVAKR